MRKCLSTIILLLMSTVSLTSNALGAVTTSPSTDLSIKCLCEIFGEVPGALNGGRTGFLGRLFSAFNEGIMVVVAVRIGR